jgi:hypothetical protein
MELELPVPAQHQADDARAPRSGLVDPLAQRLEAAGALLSRLQFVASSAEVADVRALVDVVAGELMLARERELGATRPAVRSQGVAAAWVADDELPADGANAHAEVEPPMDGFVETIELSALQGARLLDSSQDLAGLVSGRLSVELATRLTTTRVVVGVGYVGAAVPCLVIFATLWATGGVGQFAMAYKWPFWLEVWFCVGWWICAGLLLLAYGSLHRELAWMALKQASTCWIIAMTMVYVGASVSLYDFGVRRDT